MTDFQTAADGKATAVQAADLIVAFEPIILRIPFTHDGPPTGFGGKIWQALDYLLVRIETADGRVGYGEAFGYNVIPGTFAVLEHLVKPQVLGRNAGDVVALRKDLDRNLHLFGTGGVTRYALSGLDIALWDLLGKKANLPVAALLGSTGAPQLPVYASLLKHGDPEVVADATKRAMEEAYQGVKLHETQHECVEVARQMLPGGRDLMLDVNCAWTPDEARVRLRKMAELDLAWIEEPVWPPDDLASFARLKNAGMTISLATGENALTPSQLGHIMASNTIDIIQPSITKIGGISDFLTASTAAQAHNLTVAPHSPYFGPGLLATLQVSATLQHGAPIEWWFCDLEAPIYPGIQPMDGWIPVPQGPGLGADPDPDVISTFRIDPSAF